MKVLQIRSAFEDNGPGSQSLSIANELRDRGHVVEFCSSKCVMKEKINEAGFVFNELSCLERTKRGVTDLIRSILSVRKLIQKRSVDVIHAHNAYTAIVSYISTLLLMRSVVICHSVRGVELRPKYQWRNWIYKKYPIHIFAVSQFTKELLVKFGAKESNIVVTYNGVNLTKFDKNKTTSVKIRTEFCIPKENIIIGHVGAMSTNTKGQHILIEAFSRLCNKYSNISLIVVGDGSSLVDFKNLAIKLNVQDRVIFPGRRFDIPDFQSAFDIFCLTSIWGEMFPNAILEAMAMGNPWIGSDISGLSELTAGGRAGKVIEPGNVAALQRELDLLILNKAERARRGREAYQEVVAKFTIQKVVDRMECIYQIK